MRLPTSPHSHPFHFSPPAEPSKLAAPGPTPPPAVRPAPDSGLPLRETACPSPSLARRHPKVNFWGRLEFRQAVKLNSRTRKTV